MLVRPADEADLPVVTAIYNATLETTTHEWTERLHTVDEMTSWLQAKRSAGHPALVAVDEGEVVGWATYGEFRDATRWPGYRFTVEHSIHVDESRWRRGVGRLLLAHLVEHARQAGKRVMVAAIDAGNEGSIAFHARLGFTEVARMPGVGEKWGQRLDLVLMQQDLEPPRTS